MRKVSTLDARQRIEFSSKSFPADTFTVIDFKGEEGLSKLYRYEINLVSEKADIDLDAILAGTASLKVVIGDDTSVTHGVVAEFEELHQKDGDTFYRAVLVPRLWQLSLYRITEVYVDKTTPQVIEAILKEASLTTNDYELALTGNHTPWTHLCQYQETHFDFISRMMERNGIYFYFVQDANHEKVVITDTRTRHEALQGGRKFDYAPISGLRPDQGKPQVQAFVCRQKQLPEKVVLMDYNYRKPSLELKSEATVDAGGRGEVILYGEHADDLAEIKELAGIRAEELSCRKRVFHGESNIPLLRSGCLAGLDKHFRNDFNQNYLLVDIEHEGSQLGMVLSDATADKTTASQAPFYRNSFAAIASTVQFRPQRDTPKPRIHGTMNAVIDGEGSGKNAELDEYGRYKVRLQFDRAEHGDAKASQWVRMATPYAGTDHGMHFPLRKGTEVLLTFIDGDPNRPIIAGAVPNMDTPSVVNRDNSGNSVMRVVGGLETYVGGARNQFQSVGARAAGDVDTFGANSWERARGWDKDAIGDFAANATKTVVFDNTITHNKVDSISRTLGNSTTEVVGNVKQFTYGDTETVTGTADKHVTTSETKYVNATSVTHGVVVETTHANTTSTTHGTVTENMYGSSLKSTTGEAGKPVAITERTYANLDAVMLGSNSEVFLGNKDFIFIGANQEIALGALNVELTACLMALSITTAFSLELELTKSMISAYEDKKALLELKDQLVTLQNEGVTVGTGATAVTTKIIDIFA